MPEITEHIHKPLATRSATVHVDDIIGRPEFAEMIGVNPNHLGMLVARGTGGIPQPFLRLRSGMLFRRSEAEAWARRTGRLV